MKDYKKTLIGSMITFIIGTSCCWISSLAIWFGGVTFVGTIATFIESTQSLLIFMSSLLATLSIYLYYKNREKTDT